MEDILGYEEEGLDNIDIRNMVRGEREKYEILGIDRGEYFEEESKSYS